MDHNSGYELIGESKHIREVRKKIEAVAPFDTAVLIMGETGTGKELVANQIHLKSKRNERQLVAVNCSAITIDLAESELFGHERGAFTGAVANRPGAFELADKGTMFLDEVSTMQPYVQHKFLRALETGRFRHVGGSDDIQVDVRAIGATNNPDICLDPNFRSDLYHRLSAYVIRLLPLRERPEDIGPIAQFYLGHWCRKTGYERILASGAVPVLNTYDYPGNIRELQHILERAAIETEIKLIEPDLVREKIEEQRRQSGKYKASPETPSAAPSIKYADVQTCSDGFDITGARFPWGLQDARRELRRLQVTAAIKTAKGSEFAAAKLLKVGHVSLYKMARDMGYAGVREFYDVVTAAEKSVRADTQPSDGGQKPTEAYAAQDVNKRHPGFWDDVSGYMETRIAEALKNSNGDKKSAAMQLKMSQRELLRTIKQDMNYSSVRKFYEAHGIPYNEARRSNGKNPQVLEFHTRR